MLGGLGALLDFIFNKDSDSLRWHIVKMAFIMGLIVLGLVLSE